MSGAKKIPLDKNDFQLQDGVIYFKKVVPMWQSLSGDLDGYSFFIIDESEMVSQTVTVACQDENGDIYCYGSFGSAEEAEAWTKSPFPFY